MSRIGKKPIDLPKGVEVTMNGHTITVKGPKGTLKRDLPPEVKVVKDKEHIICSVASLEEKRIRALYGLVRSLVANMVTGVSKGYTRELQVVGTGYKVKAEGNKVVFNVGYSHPVAFEAPKEVTLKIEAGGKTADGVEYVAQVVVSGIDKELVGQMAANIRAIKTPDVYKGRGVRYVGEKVRIKEGKKLAA